MTIKIGSLFAGIGGFELGLERSIPNSETIWQVEQDKFCQKVLAKHWPNAKIYNDVREIKKDNVEYVDILCGGFPCQDISIAGKGEGIHDGKKSSFWWEMHRIISEIRPRVAVLENVSAITFRGGLDVIGSLAQIGYDAEWIIISARDFGAPHRRDRWFCVAYPHSERSQEKDSESVRFKSKGEGIQSVSISKINTEQNFTDSGSERLYQTTIERAISIDDNGTKIQQRTPQEQSVAYPNSKRCEKEDGESIQSKCERQGIWSMPISTTNNRSTTYTTGRGYWRTAHPEPLICRVDDGFSRRLDSPRLKALGNAIVPQCSEWIGKKIWESGIL